MAFIIITHACSTVKQAHAIKVPLAQDVLAAIHIHTKLPRMRTNSALMSLQQFAGGTCTPVTAWSQAVHSAFLLNLEP